MTHIKLSEYAKLVIQVGVNLQPGQTLVLSCPVQCAGFGRMIVEEAYNAGARDVVMRWQDDALDRMKFLRADDAVFDEVPQYIKALFEEYSNPNAAKVAIYASDPENLLGVDPDRIQRNTISTGTALKKYHDMMINNEFAWNIVSIPTPAWASKVFPDIPVDDAVEKLWDAILHTVRISGEGTAVKKWQEHTSLLNTRIKKLDEYHFARLIFKNSLGTDLNVELPDRHVWKGGAENSTGGTPFVANMPTEEVFTLPRKDGVNGVVYSSMPLSLNGNLIKDIKLTLKDGRIVDADASEGLDILVRELDADEGARYLGEVALVPYESPISKQGILYYNTLFDENASCHLAFGSAYPAFSNADEMTKEDHKAHGANDSFIHVDFMIGTPDLSITGITHDGHEIPVFLSGNFAF